MPAQANANYLQVLGPVEGARPCYGPPRPEHGTLYHVRRILSGESAKRFIGAVGKFKDYRYGSHPWVLEFAHGQVVAFREGEVEPFYPYMAMLTKG